MSILSNYLGTYQTWTKTGGVGAKWQSSSNITITSNSVTMNEVTSSSFTPDSDGLGCSFLMVSSTNPFSVSNGSIRFSNVSTNPYDFNPLIQGAPIIFTGSLNAIDFRGIMVPTGTLNLMWVGIYQVWFKHGANATWYASKVLQVRSSTDITLDDIALSNIILNADGNGFSWRNDNISSGNMTFSNNINNPYYFKNETQCMCFIGAYQSLLPGETAGGLDMKGIKLLSEREYLYSNDTEQGGTVWQTPPPFSYKVCTNFQDPDDKANFMNWMNPSILSYLSTCRCTPINAANINGCFPELNQINTISWMTDYWNLIKNIPANEFLFLGCHDAVASYKEHGYGVNTWLGVSAFRTGMSYTQNATIWNMLEDGCRYFDMRFADGIGAHGAEHGNFKTIYFNYSIDSFINDLSNFFAASNNNQNEILIIRLQLNEFGVITSDTETLFNNFLTKCLNAGLKFIGHQHVSPSSTLSELKMQGDIILIINDNTPFTPSGNNATLFWPPSDVQNCVSGYDKATTATEYYNDIIGIRNYPSTTVDSSKFNYLSMTQTDGSGSVNDIAQALNGPLADWILFATPNSQNRAAMPASASSEAKQNLINSGNNQGNLLLPYKKTSNGGSLRNYNLIGVDFYNKGPFVINAITQNIKIGLMINNYL